MSAIQYAVTTGPVSIAASVTAKVAISLATGATANNTVIAFDFSGDSTATGAGGAPIRVQFVRTSTVSSTTGAAYTPIAYNKLFRASVTTARIGDTVGGTLVGTGIIQEWLLPPTGPFAYQFPLGREIDMAHSDFLEMRITTPAGLTTFNYLCNLIFEE
jgi:hypothetical protein